MATSPEVIAIPPQLALHLSQGIFPLVHSFQQSCQVAPIGLELAELLLFSIVEFAPYAIEKATARNFLMAYLDAVASISGILLQSFHSQGLKNQRASNQEALCLTKSCLT